MSEVTKPDVCAEVDEQLSLILEGQAPEALLDHIAECDRCRDVRHDAERALELVAAAGFDYVAPADFDTRLLDALDRSASDRRPATEPNVQTTELDVHPTELDVRKTEELVHRTEADVHPTELDVQRTEPDAPAAAAELPAPATEQVAPSVAPAPKLTPAPAARSGKAARMRPRVVAGVLAAAAVAAIAALALKRGDNGSSASADAGWHGKVTQISSAAGGDKGVELCDADGKSCAPLANGAAVPGGSRLKTDERTRAYVDLGDGTRLALDRATEITFGSKPARWAKLDRGAIVADVAHIEGQTAQIDLPGGAVEVLGTKFALRTSSEAAAVDVSRGSVRLVDSEKRAVVVRAGEQGRIQHGMPPYASSAPTLGSAFAWSEAAAAEADTEVSSRGLGELKAKKPGKDAELDRAVTLTGHKVKVRIAGAVARTEVDETFTNHTDDVLEGIFRFPMPPDAKIERLALEVDGKMVDGAFVERDRAAAIWRGAIVNSAPQLRREIKEEIVWVPGPWRDPALLEWQRGGRFELRIYPIPKRGARRVVLAYSQLIQPTGGVRRYNYPLAHDPSGSTRVDDFQVDVEVRGHDDKFGITAQGYDLSRSAAAGADVLRLAARNFVPSGDLTLEYALPQRDAELAVWAYKPGAGELAALPKPKTAQPTAPASVATTNAADPYVAFALRPKLPRTADDAHRAFVVVVDSSRSMFGESFTRATRLAARLVRELDPLDRVSVLACDADCRALPGGLLTPSAQVAAETERFLAGIAPEGASDPTAAVRDAIAAAGGADGRSLRVIYIGDGSPTVGPIRPAYVSRAIEDTLPPGRGTLTAVAIGADSDHDTLAALARGGGGVVLPFVPGQTTAEAVFAVLGASYGNALRDVTVELPDGLIETAPQRLDTIGAGSESLLVARMTKPELKGTVTLRGKLGKENFEQRYPISISATESKGNAFVPRLYAAARIADLEREASAQAKQSAVELSQAFNVASRHTSLLVLESAAMFRAFGLDNTRRAPEWTGEEAAQVATAEGENAVEKDKADLDLANPFDDRASSGAGVGTLGHGAGPVFRSAGGRGDEDVQFESPRPAAKAARRPLPAPAPEPLAPAKPAPEAAPTTQAEAKKESSRPAGPPAASATIARPFDEPPPWRGRRMIPMRRIWERVGSVDTARLAPPNASASLIATAEADLERDQNRREAVKKLYVLYALAGDVERASRTAERWSNKEPLDPEALTARADLAARGGDRELSIKILGSVVDVRPGDVKAQTRLARLHRWAGDPTRACRHTLAIAQLRASDASLLADAVRCGRATGQSRLADDMLAASEAKTRSAAETLLAKADPTRDDLSGDLRVEATWSGSDDLDVALLDPDGNRISWLGAPTRAVISARDVKSLGRESLALRGGKPGSYVVEIVRGAGGGPVRGELVISVAGTRRTVPFSLDTNRTTVALAKIAMQSRLVPL